MQQISPHPHANCFRELRSGDCECHSSEHVQEIYSMYNVNVRLFLHCHHGQEAIKMEIMYVTCLKVPMKVAPPQPIDWTVRQGKMDP